MVLVWNALSCLRKSSFGFYQPKWILGYSVYEIFYGCMLVEVNALVYQKYTRASWHNCHMRSSESNRNRRVERGKNCRQETFEFDKVLIDDK